MHGGTGLIPNRETKIPHVTQHGPKKKKSIKECVSLFLVLCFVTLVYF